MITKQFFDELGANAARQGKRHPLADFPRFAHLFAPPAWPAKCAASPAPSRQVLAARDQSIIAEIIAVVKDPAGSPFAHLAPRETNRMAADAI
jgi:hypothetical protein